MGYSPWGCRVRHDWVTNIFSFLYNGDNKFVTIQGLSLLWEPSQQNTASGRGPFFLTKGHAKLLQFEERGDHLWLESYFWTCSRDPDRWPGKVLLQSWAFGCLQAMIIWQHWGEASRQIYTISQFILKLKAVTVPCVAWRSGFSKVWYFYYYSHFKNVLVRIIEVFFSFQATWL